MGEYDRRKLSRGYGPGSLALTRRQFLTISSIAFAGGVCGRACGFTEQAGEIDPRVSAFFENHLIIDGVVQPAPKDGTVPTEKGEIKHQTGIDAAFMTTRPDIIEQSASWVQRSAEKYQLIRSAKDIDDAYAAGRYAVGLYLQKDLNLSEGLDKLERWYELGLRQLQPTYTGTGELGGGQDDDETPLTPLGKDVLRLCEELGIIFDVSHCGIRTTMDVLRLAKKPVTANHCNAYSKCKSRRNKTDAELRAIAGTGGVIGVMAINCFLVLEGKAEVNDFCNHVEYMVRRFGMNHVGVASDSSLDGGNIGEQFECGPSLYCYERWANVAANLFQRGFKEEHLAKIFGLNFKRVYDEILV